MNDQRKKQNQLSQLAVMILSLVLSVITIQYLFSDRTDFSDFDLGTSTTSVFAKANEIPIHFSVPSIEAENSMLADSRNGGKPILLVLGNSQTHSINRYDDGQSNLVGLLHDSVPDFYVIAHTLPNANLQELLILFLHWIDKCDPQFVVLPVFFDDTREDSLRQDLASYAHVVPVLKQSGETGERLALQLSKIPLPDTELEKDPTIPIERESLQDRSEKYLNEALNARLPIWRKRPAVRGEIFLTLYLLRNTVLGLTSQSKRPILSSPMNHNLQALEEILRFAESRKIEVLLYFPPLRQDIPPPYDMDEYRAFKARTGQIAAQYKTTQLCDLDSIVPGELWGMKESTNLSGKPEYDFMHFRYEGHMILAEAIKNQIDNMRATK